MGNEAFSHLDPDGKARMVDISEKQDSTLVSFSTEAVSWSELLPFGLNWVN